jgi:replicative DNA helicase
MEAITTHTLDLERHLFGVILWSRDAYKMAAATLSPADLSSEQHKIIFEAIAAVAGDPAQVLDPAGVKLELERVRRFDAAGGDEYLVKIASAEPDPRRLERLIGQVADAARRRAHARDLTKAALAALDPTVPLDDTALRVRGSADIAVKGSGAVVKPIGARLNDLLALFDHPETKRGLPSGIPQLDELTGGFQPQHLITIAGGTGMGKSSLASQISIGAAYIASKNPGRFGAEPGNVAPVLYFTYEMSEPEMLLRMVAQVAPVAAGFRIGQGWHSADKAVATAGAHKVLGLPLFVFDDAGSTVEEVRSAVDRFTLTNGKPSLVVVDYIGLLTTPGITNEVQGISHITKSLKSIARDHDIPVVQLAQINREAGNREAKGGHKPRLSDLRSSGSIEHDSNIVIFVYNEALYGNDPDQQKADEGKPQSVEVIVAKNRSGRRGTLRMTWIGHRFLFVPDASWVSSFSASLTNGPGFIEYPVLVAGKEQTYEGRILETLLDHFTKTAEKCSRSVIQKAFGKEGSDWNDTGVLFGTIEKMVTSGQVLNGHEGRSQLYWLPGQFPPTLVAIDGGQEPTTEIETDPEDTLFA